MTPLELLARLAAFAPPPRSPRLRYQAQRMAARPRPATGPEPVRIRRRPP